MANISTLNTTHVRHSDFVTNVYADPECTQHVFTKPTKKQMGITILRALHEPELSIPDLIRLRAAFKSLTDYYHGVKDRTGFYIIKVEVSDSEVFATVRTDHGNERQLVEFITDFLEMVDDPWLDRGNSASKVWAGYMAENIGKAPRMAPVCELNLAPTIQRQTLCWCCDKQMTWQE